LIQHQKNRCLDVGPTMNVPIIIPTLNRYQHLKRCIASLQNCKLSEKAEVIIALDYPSNESQWDGYKKIGEYLEQVKGFAALEVIKRDHNFGAQRNYLELVSYVNSRYDGYVYIEDDCEFSPNFLDYINKGLEKFKDDPRIIAICGDGGTFKKPGDYTANYIYRKGFSAWGYGTWNNRLDKVDYDVADMRDFVADPELRKRLKYYYERHYYTTLTHIYHDTAIWGDGAIVLDMIKNDTYCVYPTVSKVRNHGHDGSGEHGGNLKDSPYSKVILDQDLVFEYEGDPVFDDPRYLAILRNRTRFTPKKKLKFWLRAAQKPKKMLDLWKLVH